ncbi:MAG TPA: hypothetical protein GXX51_08215 [Firmicutes bacterium]|nr:hypothetical protein [Bacillota bacterium]
METFAFIVHPDEVRVRDVALEPPALKRLHARAVEGLMRFVPPFPASRITGVRSTAGGETEGWIVSCPLTLRQMDSYSGDFLRRKVMQGLSAARRVGAKVVGVGMVDAVFSRRRIQVDYGSGVCITTGRGLAIGSGLKGLTIAAHEVAGVDPVDAWIVVLGAATATGIACSRLLAKEVRYLALVDFHVENGERLKVIAARLLHETGLAARLALPVDPGFRDVIERADILIIASDVASERWAAIMRELNIRPGALIFRIFPGRGVSRAAAAVPLTTAAPLTAGAPLTAAMPPAAVMPSAAAARPAGAVPPAVAAPPLLNGSGTLNDGIIGDGTARNITRDDITRRGHGAERHGHGSAGRGSYGVALDGMRSYVMGAGMGGARVHVMDDAVLQIPGDFRMDPPIELPVEVGSPYVVEPMILALEGADDLPPQGDIAFARWVEEVIGLAEKHGFVVTGAMVNGGIISRGALPRGTRDGIQGGHVKIEHVITGNKWNR